MSESSIGHRLKALRQEKNLSLEDLAKRTGLNMDFLTALEDNEQYPSLGPLLKVSRLLGVRLGTLLDDNISDDPLVIRQEERIRQMTTHRGPQKETCFYSLGRGKNDRHMEPFFIELMPGEKDDNALSTHEGEEFIVVISGQAELLYGHDRFVLKTGDSIYYNSCVPHQLRAFGQEKTEIYAVLYLPE